MTAKPDTCYHVEFLKVFSNSNPETPKGSFAAVAMHHLSPFYNASFISLLQSKVTESNVSMTVSMCTTIIHTKVQLDEKFTFQLSNSCDLDIGSLLPVPVQVGSELFLINSWYLHPADHEGSYQGKTRFIQLQVI